MTARKDSVGREMGRYPRCSKTLTRVLGYQTKVIEKVSVKVFREALHNFDGRAQAVTASKPRYVTNHAGDIATSRRRRVTDALVWVCRLRVRGFALLAVSTTNSTADALGEVVRRETGAKKLLLNRSKVHQHSRMDIGCGGQFKLASFSQHCVNEMEG